MHSEASAAARAASAAMRMAREARSSAYLVKRGKPRFGWQKWHVSWYPKFSLVRLVSLVRLISLVRLVSLVCLVRLVRLVGWYPKFSIVVSAPRFFVAAVIEILSWKVPPGIGWVGCNATLAELKYRQDSLKLMAVNESSVSNSEEPYGLVGLIGEFGLVGWAGVAVGFAGRWERTESPEKETTHRQLDASARFPELPG